ncbi:MAG TPA: MDR family MFS transporter [Ignavibacteriaceae bacterium]|nr:MDR family MFS transporter [Ignavibacteriaceae bacterium]
MMLANFMAAVEATIVATAIPTIVSSLGGFSLFTWVFSAFLLTQGVTIPLYGKLSDLYGRKKVFTFGVSLFLVGSALCGFAGNMYMLITFRAIQGIGAGAVLPTSQTIIGDIYNLEERARVQGYLSSVWGFAAIIGPAIGGIIVQNISWAWIFFINIPIGFVCIFLVYLYFHETEHLKLAESDVKSAIKSRIKIDYLGSFLLITGISLLLFPLLEAGNRSSIFDIKISAMIGVSILIFIWFGRVERRAENPVIPFKLLKKSVILFPNIISMVVGIATIAISSIIPMFAQGVFGSSAITAGFLLASMSIGWPLASSQSGKLILKSGFRFTALLGIIILLTGSLLMLMINQNSGLFEIVFYIFIIGIGLGLTSTTSIVAVQHAVPWSKRGVATSSNSFMRMLGSAFGATLFGWLLNFHIQSRLPASQKNIDIIKILVDPVQRVKYPSSFINHLQNILADAVHSIYIYLALIVFLGIIAASLIPKEIEEKSVS